MNSGFDSDLPEPYELVVYDNFGDYVNADNNVDIQNQLVISFLLVKLCKERGLNIQCFQRILSKL